MPPTTATMFATGTRKRKIHYRIFGHAHRAPYEGAINTTLARYNSFFTYPTSMLPAESASTPHPESTASSTFLLGQLITAEQAPTAILAQQLPPTIPNERSGGNALVAVVVAIVVMGSLVGVIVGGEIMRRQRRRQGTREGSDKDGTDLVPDKGKEVFDEKSPDSSTSSLQNSPTSIESLAFHLKHATRPVKRTTPSWFSRIFRKAQAILHHKNAESPTEASRASRTPADRSAELPQRTTWSDFSYTPEPNSLSYPRPLLHCILEECEDDCHSQSGSEIALTLGLAIQRSLDSIAITSSVHGASQAKLFATIRKSVEAGSIVEERYGEDQEDAHDVGFLESVSTGMSVSPSGLDLAPTASLQTVDTGASADRESLREEMFELRRVQTRSMQMDKPILLSLGFKAAGDENDEPSDTETEHAPGDNTMTTPLIANLLFPPGCEGLRPDLRDLLGSQITLATLASSYSAVDLDDFPLPPAIVLPRP
ncbi:uncharacterized protein F5891DRAFT_1070194 [Suillus fuscotomentosus]|uniref:Uncharacterized protein n=1 Tax=Suillus fuscotomentosus TaxID=1912939 RepID=A0AAD4DR94_9AGAM|nr:uncharacterized protein F5891DRAFT_1070194 [Suillus fuscotomentosus]KAG1891561.1 hypothetical protein F5891DRAFT_1070194 [Suillus fuscotomentosus]